MYHHDTCRSSSGTHFLALFILDHPERIPVEASRPASTSIASQYDLLGLSESARRSAARSQNVEFVETPGLQITAAVVLVQSRSAHLSRRTSASLTFVSGV